MNMGFLTITLFLRGENPHSYLPPTSLIKEWRVGERLRLSPKINFPLPYQGKGFTLKVHPEGEKGGGLNNIKRGWINKRPLIPTLSVKVMLAVQTIRWYHKAAIYYWRCEIAD